MWYDIMVTIGALIFATLILVTLFQYLEPAKVAADYKRCNGEWHEGELNHCHAGLLYIPQQPVNTYSNLAYLAAGLYVQFSVDTGPAFVFAVAMTYLAIGSSLYHATSTGWAGMLDVTGIFTVFTAIVTYALAAVLGAGQEHVTPTLMFLAAGLSAFLLSRRYSRYMRAVIAICLGTTYLILLIHMAVTDDWAGLRYLAASFALFAIGFYSWGLDKKRKFPLKRWGHGLWHLLTAAASAVVFIAIDVVT